MRVVGLLPSFNEGAYIEQAARSLLSCCDTILCSEGPIKGAPGDGEQTDFRFAKRDPRITVQRGIWTTEAEKRTEMIQWAQRRQDGPVWVVLVDADEILLWGENLRDLIRRQAEQDAHDGTQTDAMHLRRVEMDATVGMDHARVIRADLVERFILSRSQYLLRGSATVRVAANEPIWSPGDAWGVRSRPPLQGEPHILHRSFLRPPGRDGFRLAAVEAADFESLAGGVILP